MPKTDKNKRDESHVDKYADQRERDARRKQKKEQRERRGKMSEPQSFQPPELAATPALPAYPGGGRASMYPDVSTMEPTPQEPPRAPQVGDEIAIKHTMAEFWLPVVVSAVHPESGRLEAQTDEMRGTKQSVVIAYGYGDDNLQWKFRDEVTLASSRPNTPDGAPPRADGRIDRPWETMAFGGILAPKT